MASTYLNYIGGEWVSAKSGQTFPNISPANNDDIVGYFQQSDAEDMDMAIAAAQAAAGKWRLTPAPRRAEIIYRSGQILMERKEQFSHEMTREMGKIIKETRGDTQEAIDTAFYAAGEGRRLFGHTTPSEMPNKFAMCIREPLGVCGLITPWNFPMAIPSWKIYPSLVAGNTAVIKPASDTPISTYNLVKSLEEAGLPPGVLNLVTGPGGKCGMRLCESSDVQLVSFTGSTDVGRAINVACAPSFKRVSMEMGGKNAIIIMDDADLELALEGAIWGGFGTTGQRCTAASRLIVHKDVLGKFTEMFLARVRTLRLGDGLDPKTEVGPLVSHKQVENVHAYTEIGQKDGAKLLCGGEPATEGALKKGSFYKPTIFADVHRNMRIAREEIFGPTVAILPVGNLEEAISVCNDTPYGLSASIYTRNVNQSFAAMRDIHTGIVYVNAPTIGAEVHLPFGGTKETGNGHREGGQTVIDIFTEWKTLYIDYSGQLQRAQIDQYEG